MKYFVVATRWDSERKEDVKYIVGEFNKFMNASIFRDAYNNYYSANAFILDELSILNK